MRTTFASQGGEWMIRQQELIVKEARQQLAHPSTQSSRSLVPAEQLARASTPGSMLRIGLNPDPMKAKSKRRQADMNMRGSQLGPSMGQSASALAAANAGDRDKLARSKSAGLVSGSGATDWQQLDPLAGKTFQATAKGTSSARHYFDQQTGFVQSPYGVGGGMGGASQHALEQSSASGGFQTRDLLYCGVSQECEGRYAYLRLRKKEDLGTRFGTTRSLTSNGEVGWRLANQKATEQYAPKHVGTARGTLMRTLAADAPALMKTNTIVDERIKMERILGIKAQAPNQ